MIQDPILLESLSDVLLLEIRRQTCELLGSFFGYVIQGTLGVVAFLSLIIKWRMEPPGPQRREPREFILDTSKQAVGSLLAHFLNLLFAAYLTSDQFQNECLFYLVAFLIDSIFGLLLDWVLLRTVEWVARNQCGTNVLESGTYPPGRMSFVWGVQLGAWCAIVIVVKLILLFGIVVPLKPHLYNAGKFLMTPFENYPKLELVIVMIVIPLILNVIVFWWTDNYLMKEPETPFPKPPTLKSTRSEFEREESLKHVDKHKARFATRVGNATKANLLQQEASRSKQPVIVESMQKRV